MNKMKKISLIANEIGAIIERVQEAKESYDDSVKWRKEKLEKLENSDEENISSWDLKYAKDEYEEYMLRSDICDDIIKYLESYKF